jgi:glycerol kinase
VWQCRRSEPACARLRRDGRAAWVREVTGLPIDAYFSATKLAWLLDHVPGARERARRGELMAGTLDTYTLHRLSRGRLFVTDPSTACRTLLAPLASGRWSEELCGLFEVPRALLAEVVASDADLGAVAIAGGEVRVRGILCDQPAALLGSGCTAPGDVKCTYGTGAFVQFNTGGAPAAGGDDGLLRSIAWELGGARSYLLEGSVLAAGDVITWLGEGLGVLAQPGEVERVLAGTRDSGGVVFLPALTGLGAPRWVGAARGGLLGLHRGARREHVIRAALEGVAHQVADVLDAAGSVDAGRPLWADGGVTASSEFLQLQADLAGRTLQCAAHPEVTTRGVAAVAAAGAGLTALDGVRAAPARTIAPRMDPSRRAAARERHRKLVELLVSAPALELSGTGDEEQDPP